MNSRAWNGVLALAAWIILGITPVFANDDALTFRALTQLRRIDPDFTDSDRNSVSPDGRHLYAIMSSSGTILTFSRDRNDGTLQYLRSTDLPGEHPDPRRMVLSPDGRFIYLTATGLTGNSDGVISFARNPISGGLVLKDIFQGILFPNTLTSQPDLIAISPDGKNLYVHMLTYTQYGLTVLSVNSETGHMEFVQQILHTGQFVDGFSESPTLEVSPDGKNVYIGDGSSGNIAIYARDAATGMLSHIGFVTLETGQPSLGPVPSISVSLDGRHVYATVVPSNSIFTLDRDAAGLLTISSTVALEAPDPDFVGWTLVRASPDNQRVYAANENIPNFLTAFARDPDTGQLSLLEEMDERTFGLPVFPSFSDVTVSPDSRNIYIPNGGTHEIYTFSVERPDLPCEDQTLLSPEFKKFARAYDLYEDMDGDGLPEVASVALISEAACKTTDDAFDEAITNAYLNNLAAVDIATYPEGGKNWAPYRHGMAALMMIRRAMKEYVDVELSSFGVDSPYSCVAVECGGGNCEPADMRGSVTAAATPPFAGEGDPDNDGFTNAEEWANVLARGGDEREFAVSALDPANDGSTVVTFESGNSSGSCFIATAAYGTPLAAELNSLRAFRDSRLLPRPIGAAFVDGYYRLGPAAAQFIAEQPWARLGVRVIIAAGFWMSLSICIGVGFAMILAFAARAALRSPRPRVRRCLAFELSLAKIVRRESLDRD